MTGAFILIFLLISLPTIADKEICKCTEIFGRCGGNVHADEVDALGLCLPRPKEEGARELIVIEEADVRVPLPGHYDFHSMMLHEISHVLGLDHNDGRDGGGNPGVMSETLPKGTFRWMTNNDWKCLERLYKRPDVTRIASGDSAEQREDECDSPCCFGDGTCAVMLPQFCEELGGVVTTDCETCQPVATDERSWSAVKALYR